MVTHAASDHFTWQQALGLSIVAVFAGAINSVAGGGSFLTFPALIFTGMPSVQANATNTVAVWPGSLASMGAYRRELAAHRNQLLLFTFTSLLGGLLGALLLLRTPDSTFDRLMPWLLLAATLIFTYGKHLTAWLREKVHLDLREPRHIGPFLVAFLLQLLIAVYGGFFGAGIGILMLAMLSLLGYENIHAMNGLKTLLSTVINGIAMMAFSWSDIVAWPQAIVMMIGATLGGYYGAVLAQRVAPETIRRVVIGIGTSMTLYFFLRQFTA